MSLHHRFSLPGACLLLVLGACSSSAIIGGGPTLDDDDAVDDDDAGPTDADGDGDPAETDCDDNDPEVASTFDEVCGDGKDNDCDEETRCYAVRRDQTEWIEPLAGGLDVLDWYGYDDDGHGLDIADTLVVMLYRDPGDDIWLVISVDGIGDGSDGDMALDISDLGEADLELSDDPGEGTWVGDEIWFDFRWAGCCADGGVIGPLDDDFCVRVNVLSGHDGLEGGLVTYDGSTVVDLGRPEGQVDLCIED